MAITRNAGATYVIPSENEWYKAAYYNPSNASYWLYPTQSNTAPSNVLSATGKNNANYETTRYTDPTNKLTPVGAFAASPGPYGTYDMGGDLSQWTEGEFLNATYRGWRGGVWYEGSQYVASTDELVDPPTGNPYGGSYGGFRVAEVPEPSSITLVVCGGLCLLALAWRRHRAA
jgi:formylglycine-generating enzyme required for sulfatase activity